MNDRGNTHPPEAYTVAVDERGSLLPVEFDTVPFPVRRAFVVHGAQVTRPRGNHFTVCEELVILLSGRARLWKSPVRNHADQMFILDTVGQTLWLRPSDYVVYELDGDRSAIMVLASEPYSARPGGSADE